MVVSFVDHAHEVPRTITLLCGCGEGGCVLRGEYLTPKVLKNYESTPTLLQAPPSRNHTAYLCLCVRIPHCCPPLAPAILPPPTQQVQMPFDGNSHKMMGLIAHPGEISSLSVSGDGNYLVTAGGRDLTVNVWKINTQAVQVTKRQMSCLVSEKNRSKTLAKQPG